MAKKRLVLLSVSLFAATVLTAQVKVTGVVVGSDGPLIGAMVILKGTSSGATTDMNGSFSILSKDPQNDVLQVQYIGMTTMDYALNGKTADIEIRMADSANDLDDVVVIGYGTARRGDLTGSIATVSGKTLSSQPIASAAEALQGRVAGVQVTTQDGAPDADVIVLVRGRTSINNDYSPLYIVDGFQVDNLNDIPPSDIESISILKDASATAIYGARGANGVLIVTTKQGQAGKTQVSLTAYTQWRTLAKKLDVMGPYEFTKLYYEYAALKGMNSSYMEKFYKNFGHPGDLYIYKGYEPDDWQEDIMGRTPTTQFYTLNVSGGSKQTVFNFGLSYNQIEGQHLNTGTDRISLNFKLRHEASKRTRLEFNTRYSKITNLGSDVNPSKSLLYRPVNGIRDFVEISEDDMDLAEEEIFTKYPPSEETKQNWKENARESLNFAGALVLTPVEGVTYRSEFGIDIFSHTLKRNFYGALSGTAKSEGNRQPMLTIAESWSPRYKWTNTLNWDLLSGKTHSLNLMAGQEIMSEHSEAHDQSVYYFPANTTRQTAFNNLELGTTIINQTETSAPIRTLSFFGRMMYNYRKTYFFDATFRADASSKFGPDNRWAYFPSAAFMWRVNNMEFLKNYKPLSNLKLRLSYGSAGNDRIPAYAVYPWYSLTTSLSGSPGFESTPQTYLLEEGSYQKNSNLIWETTWQANIGLDFGFFNERINGTFEVYHNTTKDLLLLTEVPISAGYSNQWRNVGQTSARGIEITLNGRIVEKRDWNLSSTFNIGFNRTRVDKLASGETEWPLQSKWASTQRGADDFRVIVGQPIGLMYGFVYDGMYTIDDFERDASGNFVLTSNGKVILKEGVVNMESVFEGAVRPGDVKFKKLTPNTTNERNPAITDADRQIIGQADPKFSGGFGFNAAYKGVDLSIFFNFMYGFDILNGVKGKLTSLRSPGSYENMSALMERRFRYCDDEGNLLLMDANALEALNANAEIYNPISLKNAATMSWLIEDGSFLRLNNLTLGYTFPAKWTRKAGVSNFRVYVTGNNLWLWTKYSGYDPEINMKSGNLTPNVDYDKTYPRSRVYTIGANLKF